MMRLRLLCGAFVLSLLLGSDPALADDRPAEEQLTRAIKLYNAGDYAESRDLLRDIDQDALDEDGQVELQLYLVKARTAISRVSEAKEDFEAGLASMRAKDYEKAKKFFERVVNNEFAPSASNSSARTHLKEINAKLAASHVSSRPTTSHVATRPVTRSQRTAGGKTSLISKLSEEYDLLWQQAVRIYGDTVRKIRQAVLKEDFAEAHRLMDFAMQTLEMNRRYATPATAYEDYRSQALDLERYIEDEERDWQEREIERKHSDIAKRIEDQRNRVEANKIRQIEGLFDQASELRKERRYEDAIQVLEQILVIDPNNDQAAWKRETLEDLAMGIRDRKAVDDRSSESQSLLIENDESMIPWNDHLRYPKDWLALSAKRAGAEEAAEPEENRIVRQKLRKIATELKFDAVEFERVIDNLRTLTGLNFQPNWAALEAAGIEKDAEVTMNLQNVKFEKALTLILDEVGASEIELAFEIDGGVIQISTKEDFGRKAVTRVYNVQDLIISVPTFRGRQLNLQQVGQQTQQGGLGGGRYLQGQGGAGGGAGRNIFGGGGGQGDDLDQNLDEDPLEPIIQLIQDTIDPESWREAGGNVGAIQALNQQIIVTQTSAAHAQLRDLLRQLRRARALQIAVEARYITISRNWLEQIGVDLDIVLNNGNAGFDRTTLLDPATGNPLLLPRRFTRLGFAPGAPGGIGLGNNMTTTTIPQPFGQPGLVPGIGGVGPASGSMTRIPMVNNTLQLASPADTNVPGSLGSLVNSTPAFQVFGSFLDNIQVDFLLRASQVDRRSSDLDAPRLVLFNGQRATFESFIEQDYIAALTPIIGDNAGAFLPNINTALTGRSLDVQATVSADRRYVTMTVRTFTRVTGDFRTVFFAGSQTVGSGFVELATQTTQQIRTTVSVPDGGTLLIGGLKLSGERDVDAGVPILSRIPILKRAFSNTSNVKDDQILLILIKPTIIIQEEAEREAFPTLSAVTP